MTQTRSRITADMLRDWQRRGVTIQQAADQIGMGRNTIVDQERRHGITLPRAIAPRGTFGGISGDKRAAIRSADNTRVKAWSCAPEAIQRALREAAK